MIFYFTGTGNSLFCARRLLSQGEQLVSIADCINKNEYYFSVGENESVGIVFPVYFYTVPDIIKEFINKLQLENAGYVYAVITCGGGIAQAGALLGKILAKKNIKLNYVTEMLMPDNSMLFYQIPPMEKAYTRLEEAEKRLVSIKADIAAKKNQKISKATFISDMGSVGYKLCQKTAKFYADDNCIGCGLCAKNCPQRVIELVDGKPVWKKDSCSKCSSCINRCPKAAIQYGKATIGRNRYVNKENTK